MATENYLSVLRLPGAARFSGAVAVARLAQAMLGLGSVLMLTGLGRSYTLAGSVAGAIAAGVVVGASQPQLGAYARARWTVLLSGDPRTDTAPAIESLIEEAVFGVEPVLFTVRVAASSLMTPSRDRPTSDQVVQAPLKAQFEAFIDEHRAGLSVCLDGLTEEEARRRLVPSATTLLGLVKHAAFVERVWFDEAVTRRTRREMGLPPNAADSFVLSETDTIASVRRTHDEACAESRRNVARLDLDDVLPGNRRGPLPLRWVYLHVLRELAQHGGHADILREQILSAA